MRGITTDDEAYDIQLGGFHIANTGFDYEDPEIIIKDKDRDIVAAEVSLTVVEGRIVDYDIINSGSGFRRLPKVRIKDKNGFGAKLLPIMNVVSRQTDNKPQFPTQNCIVCPNNQQNLEAYGS